MAGRSLLYCRAGWGRLGEGTYLIERIEWYIKDPENRNRNWNEITTKKIHLAPAEGD